MKKITNTLVAVIFSFCLLFTTVAPASAAKVGKVKGLKAVATPTSVTLSWTRVSGSNGYHVQQQVSKKWRTIKTITKAKTVKYKVTNLKPNQTYKFRVRAYIKKGKKTTNGSFAKITAKTTIAQVTGLSTTSTLRQVTAKWAKVTGASGYEVVYSTSKKFTKKTTKTVTIKKQKTVKTTIKNLKAEKNYYVKVRTYTTVGQKKYYGAYSAVSKIKTAVPAVSNFKVKSVTHNSAVITWKKLSGINGYQVEKLVSGKWTKVNYKVGKSKTQFTVGSLASAANTQIRIRAYQKLSGKTYYGAWQTVTASTNVGAVSGLGYSSLKSTSVKLTWKAAPGAVTYNILNNGKAVKTGVKGTSLDLAIAAGTSYKITVVGVNGSKKGAASNAVSFTSVPAKVTGVKVNSVNDSSATVSFAKTTGATGYQLQYSTNGSSWTTVSSSSATIVARNLLSNTNYSFRVRAYNKNGSTTQYGEYSAVVKATTTGISASSVNDSSASLKWSAVSGASEYVVQYYNTETSTWEDKTTVSGTSYTASDLGTAKAGLYRVVAKNSAGKVVYTSEGFTATTAGYTVTQDNYKVTISWPSSAGITTIKRSSQDGLEYSEAAKTTSVTYYLAPGLVHTIELVSGTTAIASFGIETPAIDVNDKSDSSVNSQLLYLTEAINRSKTDTSHKTTIKGIAKSTHSITSLAFGIMNLSAIEALPVDGILKAAFGSALKGTNHSISGGYIKCNDAASVAKFCEVMNDGETVEANKMHQTETSTSEKTVTFEKNTPFAYVTEGDSTVLYRLNKFIEPSGDDYFAEIYNGNNPSAWKNGFSSVKTTKTSSGYTVTATLKAESTPNYHNGFMTTFSSSASSIDGMEVLSSLIGATTITAVIDNECRLTSYKINSPYKNNVGVKMPLTGEDAEGIADGDGIVIEMNMAMEGRLNYEYTFTRTK